MIVNTAPTPLLRSALNSSPRNAISSTIGAPTMIITANSSSVQKGPSSRNSKATSPAADEKSPAMAWVIRATIPANSKPTNPASTPHPASLQDKRKPKSIRGPLPFHRVTNSGQPAKATQGNKVPTIAVTASGASSAISGTAAKIPNTMAPTRVRAAEPNPHRGARNTAPRSSASVTVTGQPG